MKNGRQKQILSIITENNVETQEDLILRLKEAGFKATQATVSRDIKELKIIKISADNGHYKYVQSTGDDQKNNAKYGNVLRETVVSVRRGGTLLVVKTYTGMAMAAATALDSLQSDKILGSIAGDDTIFIAVADEKSGKEIEDRIDSIVKEGKR